MSRIDYCKTIRLTVIDPMIASARPQNAVVCIMVPPVTEADGTGVGTSSTTVMKLHPHSELTGDGKANVVLHPLALMNIADHHSRFVAMDLFPGPATCNEPLTPDSRATVI